MLLDLLSTNPDWIQTIVRLILGVVFFAHGAQKALGWFDGTGLKETLRPMHETLGLPPSIAVVAALAEFLGGLGLIAGLLGRVAAAGIVVVMLAAIVMVNGRYGLFLNGFADRKGHGYEYHLLAIALAVVIIVRGSGAMSLDRLLYISIGMKHLL
ncbi:MAG: DoxX family protein [Bryobacteraceae bacterium]